jgi:hypothetical protein
LKQKPILEIEMPKLYPKQKEIARSIIKGKNLITTIAAGRQGGKSYLTSTIAMYYGVKYSYKVWYVLPSESQCKEVYNLVNNAIGSLPNVKKKNSSNGHHFFEFIGGGNIHFKSAGSEHSLRGASVDILVLDECAFADRRIFEEIIFPTLTAKGKKVILVSSPKGKNWFYEYYLKGLDTVANPDYKSFHFTSRDNPKAKQAIIDIAKNNMPDLVFRQEYLAEFVDGAAVFPNIYELTCINEKQVPKYKTCYMGIDIGLRGDSTVITCLNEEGEMFHQEAINNTTSPDIKSKIIERVNHFRPVKCVIEANGIGLPIIQDLEQIHGLKNIESFQTTNTSKQEIINSLINAFASKSIKLFNNEDLRTELNAFTMSFTQSGKIRYAAVGNFHDDRVMSLAFAYLCFQKYKKKGNKYFIYRAA